MRRDPQNERGDTGMKIKSQKDFWSGLMFVVVGLGFAAGATNYNFGSSARPGPGFFPFGLGILLAVLGAMILFKAPAAKPRPTAMNINPDQKSFWLFTFNGISPGSLVEPILGTRFAAPPGGLHGVEPAPARQALKPGVLRITSSIVVRPSATFIAPASRSGRMPSFTAWRLSAAASSAGCTCARAASVISSNSYRPTRPR
jgi:hypothetical protein